MDGDGHFTSPIACSFVSRYHTHPKFLPFPAKHVALRGAQEEKYTLVDITRSGEHMKIIEEIEISRALFEIYEGGVVRRCSNLMHEARSCIFNLVYTSRADLYCKHVCKRYPGVMDQLIS